MWKAETITILDGPQYTSDLTNSSKNIENDWQKAPPSNFVRLINLNAMVTISDLWNLFKMDFNTLGIFNQQIKLLWKAN